MKTMARIAVAVMLLSGVAVGAAFAQPAECPGVQTLTNFQSNPCVDMDKLYTYISSTLPTTNVNVEIDNFSIGGIDTHNFSINPVGALLGPATYVLEYSVEITVPDRHFLNVSIDSDVPASGSDVDIAKSIFTCSAMNAGCLFATITSLDGNPGGPQGLPDVSTIWIHEVITIGANGALNSFTDTFTQVAPEPMTLALLGAGLAALGFARRRK